MPKIYRNDIYVRDEKGGEWFNEFLRSFAEKDEPPTTQSILDAVNQKRGETIESVVSKYRAAVGLDSIAETENETDNEIIAMSSIRPISIRHAQMLADDENDKEGLGNEENQGVVVIIEGDPNIKADLESMLESSGGTKNTHAIINFLREILGSDLVSYSDDDLITYIDDMKGKYTIDLPEEPGGYAGKVGTEPSESYDDDTADYVEHGKGKGG